MHWDKEEKTVGWSLTQGQHETNFELLSPGMLFNQLTRNSQQLPNLPELNYGITYYVTSIYTVL